MTKKNKTKTDKKSAERVSTRGRTFRGTVVSTKMQKTATVEWNRRVFVPKYERYMFKRSRIKAHNPPEMSAKEGDEVVIEECRPLSKTKKFIITEVIKE